MVDHNRLPKAWQVTSAQRRGSDQTPAQTLAEVIEIEPQVGILLDQAKRVRNANWRDYEAYKRQFKKLVGWKASDPRLATERAYDLMIDALTKALRI